VPVVSVGNLTLGGTGKTPCVESVVRFYRNRGRCVAILSRGYGTEKGANDEAVLLEENLPDVPHLQGHDRVLLAATAVKELQSEVLVLDDGFQHRRLARDLDVVVVDATRPLVDEFLFPRGLLREPVSELRRAGAIVLTRCDQAGAESVDRQRAWLARKVPDVPVATSLHAPVELIGVGGSTMPVEELHGRPVGAFCGIGHPDAFRRTLADHGAKVLSFRTFPDHYPYGRVDVDELARWAGTLTTDSLVVTTQKDFVKLRIGELGGRPLWALRVGLRFLDGEDRFQASLEAVLGTHA
jgi:tetraacyldisaccharide 4'-kinase